MPDILKIADDANLIVNGYAFSKNKDTLRVLNLNRPDSACVLALDGSVLEATMDDIELSIVQDYYASDRRLTEVGSAKFFVKSNGDTVVQNQGTLTERELNRIQAFIKDNYKDMYLKWASMSENGYYGDKN